MGCDIHGWIEKKVYDKWVAVGEFRGCGLERNYERFAQLAGVRGEGPDPKGVPEDVSDTAKFHIDEWGVDGHSHSYMDLEPALDLFFETSRQMTDTRKTIWLTYGHIQIPTAPCIF